MKRLSIDHPRLKMAFRDAFRENAREALSGRNSGPFFNHAVMREVRQIGDAGSNWNFFDWVPKTAWRLAPVACGALFALTIFFMQYDPAFEYDMAAISLTDPVGFTESNFFEF